MTTKKTVELVCDLEGETDDEKRAQADAIFAGAKASGMREYVCVCGAYGVTRHPTSELCPPCREKAGAT